MIEYRETDEGDALARFAGSASTKPDEEADGRSVVISLAQDFVSWQFSIEGHLPSTDDGLDWEPLP